jgi:hypothetical protein
MEKALIAFPIGLTPITQHEETAGRTAPRMFPIAWPTKLTPSRTITGRRL